VLTEDTGALARVLADLHQVPGERATKRPIIRHIAQIWVMLRVACGWEI
jgi:hypothetical protein